MLVARFVGGRHVLKVFQGPWSVLVLSLVLASSVLSTAQDADSTFDEKTTVANIYNRTKTAKTSDDFGEIITQINQAREEQLTEPSAKYLQTLLAWAYNRHGETLLDQLDQAKSDEAAQQLSNQAMADFESSVKLDDGRWKTFLNRGVSYAQQGKLQEALADMTTVMRLNPDYTNAWFNRGEIYYQQGDYAKAIADYQQVLRRSPRDFGALTALGHAYFVQKDYANALSHYDRAVQLQPKSAEALANRGDAYHRRGQWDRAADDYLAAIALDDKLGRAYQSGAWLMATCPLEQFQNPERAVAAAQRAIELDGDDNYQYLDTLAAAYARLGEFEKAQETIAKAIEKAPAEEQEVLKKRQALYAESKPYDQFSLK